MQIWVDADACPGEIKELLYRVADRRKIKVTLVANQFLRTPPSRFIDTVLVSIGALNPATHRQVWTSLGMILNNRQCPYDWQAGAASATGWDFFFEPVGALAGFELASISSDVGSFWFRSR